MGMSAASHLCASSSLRALTVLFVLAAFVSDVEGRHHRRVCPHFSCGGLSNISYPFRRQGDPSGCGVQSYELVCTDTDATIRIGSGTYKVLSINSTYNLPGRCLSSSVLFLPSRILYLSSVSIILTALCTPNDLAFIFLVKSL
uniref:Wall-associated receptor kinase galacturonan-binding domain-containing protein n=1 Tax=Zea mays TaxID=4577 RepID=B6U2A4_MAIZE|nr:hypothetical protein [Zea mays]